MIAVYTIAPIKAALNTSVVKNIVNKTFDTLRRRSTLDSMKIFEQLGFSDNEEKVYLHLLKNGSGSIRQIAGDTGINRGTVIRALGTDDNGEEAER